MIIYKTIGCMERHLLAVALCVALAGSSAGCADAPGHIAVDQPKGASRHSSLEPHRSFVQQRLDALRETLGAPGATLAIMTRDGSHLSLASGVSNKTEATPMRPTDRMMSGSIGKTYVAAVLLLLLQEGRVDLDRKVSTWFAEHDWFARLPNAADITLRMLMNHTSGLPDHVSVPELLETFRADPYKTWRPEELMSFLKDKEPLFPAGEGWSYADANYIVVGMIIERVTGRTYYEELTDRILEPLKLHDTSPADRPVLRGLVSGYTTADNSFGLPKEVAANGRYHASPQMEWTGGGLISTAPDLARWAQHLYGGDVLNEDAKVLMLQGVEAGPRLGINRQYGLGVGIRTSPHGPVHGHGGYFPGYISKMAYYADHGLSIAIQVNTDIGIKSAMMESRLDEIASRLLGLKGQSSRKVSDRPSAAGPGSVVLPRRRMYDWTS